MQSYTILINFAFKRFVRYNTSLNMIWFFLLFLPSAFAVFDVTKYKMDIVCYDAPTMERCHYWLQQFSPQNENWDKIKDQIGTTKSATASTASTVLQDLESYIIVVVVLDPGQPSDTNVFDLGSLKTNHVIEFVNVASVASLLDTFQAVGNVQKQAQSGHIANERDLRKATRDAIASLHQQGGSGGSGSFPAVALKDSGDAKSKVDCLFVYDMTITWTSDITIPAVVFTDSSIRPGSGEVPIMKVDYVMYGQLGTSGEPHPYLDLNDFAVVFDQRQNPKIVKVEFGTDYWNVIFDDQSSAKYHKNLFKGDLSFLLISDSNEKQEIILEPAAGVTTVGSLNLSIQSHENLVQKIPLPIEGLRSSLATASPGLSITLKGWENVQNKVELIFEAADPEQIVVNGQEGLENVVSVKKASISDRPQGPGTNPSNPGGKPEDPDDTNIGLIVGIVVAVVAVIIIVVVLVYIFVVRKKKQESSNSGAQETASA